MHRALNNYIKADCQPALGEAEPHHRIVLNTIRRALRIADICVVIHAEELKEDVCILEISLPEAVFEILADAEAELGMLINQHPHLLLTLDQDPFVRFDDVLPQFVDEFVFIYELFREIIIVVFGRIVLAEMKCESEKEFGLFHRELNHE